MGDSGGSRDGSRLARPPPARADESERWRERLLPKDALPGRGESVGSAGEPSAEDVGVSCTLSGRRRRGGTGGVGVGVVGWCSDLDRPSRAWLGEAGESGSSTMGLSGALRSGWVGGGETSRRIGERDFDATRARNGLVSGGEEENGEAALVIVLPAERAELAEDGGRIGLVLLRSGRCGRVGPRPSPARTGDERDEEMPFAGLELRAPSVEPNTDEDALLLTTCMMRSFSRCSSALRDTCATLLACSEVWMSGLISEVVFAVSVPKWEDEIEGTGGGGFRTVANSGAEETERWRGGGWSVAGLRGGRGGLFAG